jgi:hypothetical protein
VSQTNPENNLTKPLKKATTKWKVGSPTWGWKRTRKKP